MAESKQKMLDKKLEDLVKPQKQNEEIRFKFKPQTRSGNEVLQARGLAKAFGQEKLFENAAFKLMRGERVFLIGPNGCGKTTLLRILTDEMKADAGEFSFGAKVKYGYFDQRLEGLDLTKSVLDDLWDGYKNLTTTEIRNALAAFLFKGDDVNKKVKSLSGGERARLALLKLMLSGANLLLLDEPTNHLDIASREVLEEALMGFEGTLFVVSHDRYFINKLADRVLYMAPDALEEYQGNYDHYLEKTADQRQGPQEVKSTAPAPAALEYRQRKQDRSLYRRLRARLARTEESVELLDKEIESLNKRLQAPEISADYEKIMEITNRLETARAEQEKLIITWEDTHTKLEELGQPEELED